MKQKLEEQSIDLIVGAIQGHTYSVDAMSAELLGLLQVPATKEDVRSFVVCMTQMDDICENRYLKTGLIDKTDYNHIMLHTMAQNANLCEHYIKNNKDAFFGFFIQRALDRLKLQLQQYFSNYRIEDVPEAIQVIEDKYPLLTPSDTQEIERKLKNPVYIKGFYITIFADIEKNIPDALQKIIVEINVDESNKNTEYLTRFASILHILFESCLSDEFLQRQFSEFLWNELHAECKEIQTKKVVNYLHKNLFHPKHTKYYGADSSFTKAIDEKVATLTETYSNLSSSVKHRHKNKSWYKQMEDAYATYYVKSWKALQNKGYIETEVALSALDEDNHTILWQAFLGNELEKMYNQEYTRKEKERQKNTTTQISKKYDNIPASQPVEDETRIDPALKEKFKSIVTSFKKSTKDKLSETLESIENYIRRMYKNDNFVYMSTIQEAIGPLFDDEVIELVRKLCTELDIQIKELDNVEESLADIVGVTNSGVKKTNKYEDVNDGESVIVRQVKSATLEKLRTRPELLTTEDLINIFEESSYTIENLKKLTKQLDELVTNNGLLFDGRKKKIVEYLGWDDDIINNTEKVRAVVGNYRVLKFTDRNNPPRIIRRGHNILACLDHDAYDRIVSKMNEGINIDHRL